MKNNFVKSFLQYAFYFYCDLFFLTGPDFEKEDEIYGKVLEIKEDKIFIKTM